MQLKTILNRVQKIKSFVYGAVRWVEGAASPTLEVELHPRPNGRPVCSGCGQSGPCYDRLPARRFEFVPFWGMKVFLVYAPRRVECTRCGVRVEEMPWAEGKHPVTRTYAWFLASWAKRLSWKEVAEVFQSSWDVVFGAVEMAVAYGREHLDLSGIQSLGIDEIAWGRGHRYLTVVYQIDAHCKRLLWVGEKRTVKTLLTFFHWLGSERSAALRFICSDMWKPYLKIIAKKAGQAIHVLDRFHIMGHFGKAIDEVRAQEAREIKARGQEPVLTKTRWLLLKRPENLTETQEVRLADLLRYNLRSVRSYLLKEDFQFFCSAHARGGVEPAQRARAAAGARSPALPRLSASLAHAPPHRHSPSLRSEILTAPPPKCNATRVRGEWQAQDGETTITLGLAARRGT